jgi:CO dehydrogenase maturation factor
MYEGDDFDFIAVGTKWVEGCYCLPNAALKSALITLTGSYAYILIDSPAGLEHLNRRITPEVNDIFILLDPSKKAFNHVTRAVRIIKEIGVQYTHMYLVGGYRFPIELQNESEHETRLRYLGSIDYDQKFADSVARGASLLDFP